MDKQSRSRSRVLCFLLGIALIITALYWCVPVVRKTIDGIIGNMTNKCGG